VADWLGRRLPDLAVVKVDDRIRIYGGDTDVVLHAILGYATENGTQVASLSSLKSSLEDAFVKLTGLSPLVMAAEKGGR